MVIGYDLTWMRKLNASGGVFQHSFRLVSAMAKYSDAKIVLIVSTDQERHIFKNLTCYGTVEIVSIYGRKIEDIIKEQSIQVIHTPRQEHFNLTLVIPMINTLHDLQQFHFPEFFTKNELKYREEFYKKSAEFSERVIVSYSHVRDDIVKYYKIPYYKIDVCPFGYDEQDYFKDYKNYNVNETLARYGINGKYIFYSAGTWAHKNHVRLIHALKILHEKYGCLVSLICTGYQYDYFTEISNAIQNLQMSDYVKFLGYVEDWEVPILLTSSSLAIIPTLYEAGSFPLMEAMVHHVPVVCSNVTSLPDTIGDNRFVFNPYDIDEMANVMFNMLTDDDLRQDNVRNSIKRVQLHSWERSIRKFIISYGTAIDDFNQRCMNSSSNNNKYKNISIGISQVDISKNMPANLGIKRQLEKKRRSVSYILNRAINWLRNILCNYRV